MKKGLTELVAILDMSGSMAGYVNDTIGGYNGVLKKQQDEGHDVLVTTYVFNHDKTMLHDRVPVAEVAPLTEEQYRPRSNTALMDAMGDAIRHIEKVHHYIREEDVPEHTMFFITTDGYENSSRKYTSDEIKKLVSAKQEEGWEFIYLAADIDAVETSANYGIRRERAVNFRKDRRGFGRAYESVDMALNAKIVGDSLDDGTWRIEADEDYILGQDDSEEM